MKNLTVAMLLLGIVGCANNENFQTNKYQLKHESKLYTDGYFSSIDAKKNLTFAKEQYLKMLSNLNTPKLLDSALLCQQANNICFPRAEVDEKIHMEQPEKWTNGFFQGVLWQILANKQYISDFSVEQENEMYENASYFQDAIIGESLRTNTHDLGFLLYDSFGEALRYDGLKLEQQKRYKQALLDGRNSLATRYSQKNEVFKSWDWKPKFTTQFIADGTLLKDTFELRQPWAFPVIVDNMMNLEFMLSSDQQYHHELAYKHAFSTKNNHYFYADSDEDKRFPIAYHVFDYGEHKPGNWQGLGNVSAWARGQAWSLYGFATVAEAAKNENSKQSVYTEFQAFTDRLFDSVVHLTLDDPIPIWDFFANRDDAYHIAENVSNNTAVYSNILNLCDEYIPSTILPYKGWRPIQYQASVLAKESYLFLKTVNSIKDEPMIQGDMLTPCGTKAYVLKDRVIPKDTSAAALYAAAAYRLAQFSDNKMRKEEYIEFGDKIMHVLTKHYLTSKTKDTSFKLGFVLEEATGNLPNKSEINTPIVYADFYFIEANIRKIELEM
ncbi:glycoside hydrolase family 88 protein [Paraglaciecola sp.]|uniref:glycoside hydrolase family 88 protein n=1 Tax=Paraglaciecola sp. TaxID=1920173 RepID=UPI00273E1787|nr:glycoside hydrolase family 88 protein [Paraglaciecola sp.]MDP5031528.1 glycoside hydrolase family 88 protein [Paraglaciecola sp.]